MARKGGKGINNFKLPGQDKDNWFANVDIGDNKDTNTNINKDVNKNDGGNYKSYEGSDPADKIRQRKEMFEREYTMRGFYLDIWVSEAIDELAEELGRGTKSHIVNEVMKSYLISIGRGPEENDEE
jgi:hypothetical protein